MKKQIRLLLAVLLVLSILTVGLSSCKEDKPDVEPPKTLEAPVVTLNADNSVSWNAVEGATGYTVNVNGSDLNTTTSTSFSAMSAVGTYQIKVLATDGTVKSEYSNTVSYSIFQITLPASELYTVTGETKAVGGKDYTFTLTLAEGVMGTPVVKANGTVLEGDNGKYTIKSLSENTRITVEGIKRQGTFSVTLPQGFGYTVTGADSVKEGEDYTFELEVSPSCTQSDATVKVNGELITAGQDGKYTVPAVSEDLVITVEGIEINTYIITIPEGVGYTVEGAAEAEEGADYSFTVILADGFTKSPIVVKVDGAELSAVDGVYTVPALNKDIEITVEGVVLNTYTVTFPAPESGKFNISQTGDMTVTHGDSITFTVTPLDTSMDLIVKAGTSTIAPTGTSYSVENITSDIEITVSFKTITEQFYLGTSWEAEHADEADGSISLSQNPELKGEYLKKLWDEGYTHIVFKYESATSVTSETAYVHGNPDTWNKYWRGLGGWSGKDIRIDLNEFHDGDTWYNLVFQGMDASMTVSEFRAYKSPETLSWVKASSNEAEAPASTTYLAIEDGYFVL